MIKLHNIDFHADIEEKIKNFIKSKKIITHTKGIHFGNYCLINIPDNLLPEIIQLDNSGDIQYRNMKFIIENEDINQYKKGDKITIEYLDTDFFPVRNEGDTVYGINKYRIFDEIQLELIVKAYRKKNKGWRIRSGDDVRLVKGW